MNNPSTPKTPAQSMTVQQRETKPAQADDKEMRFVPFASDTEIKLTVAIVTSLVCIPTKSGARCSPQDAIRFMMMCQARKLNPFEGDAFLQGYDSNKGPVFSLITAHQAFLKRAEVNDQYDGMESGVVLTDGKDEIIELQGDFYPKKKGYTLVGGWARVHLKHRKIPMYRRLDLATFKKEYGRWQDDPAGMIVKCAEADALRSAFPTMLGNLYLEQELNPGEKNVTPPPKIEAPSFIADPATIAPYRMEQQITEKGIQRTPKPDPDEVPMGDAQPEPAPSGPPAPTAPPPTERDVTEGMEFPQVVALLEDLMKKDGVAEDQVIGHLRNTKLAKANQTELAQLSDSKLRSLANRWDMEINAIKAVTI